MMLYFEVSDRLNQMIRFRQLYREYIGFTNRAENQPAQMIRQKMRPMVTEVVDSLRRIGLGGMITRDAPVRGGRRVRINLIKAIFRDEVIRRYNLEDEFPISLLDQGILEYRKQLWVARLQLFNPFFWLYQSVAFAARLPIFVFSRAGFDTSRVESLAPVKLLIVLVQAGIYAALIKWTGIVDWLSFDMVAL